MMRLTITLPLSVCLASSGAFAADPPLRFQVPATVSAKAAKDLAATYAISSHAPPPSKPASLEEWDRQRDALDKRIITPSKALADKLARAAIGRAAAFFDQHLR